MKITRIETFTAPPRRLFVRVETDEGVVGRGEPVIEGRAEPVRAQEPVLPERMQAGSDRVNATNIPLALALALGERLFTRREFLDHVTDPEPFRFDAWRNPVWRHEDGSFAEW
ncbi:MULTISPECIES: hypothetical protein [unclassified Streptomyces]|uniref:hypothetical protein n=1 Tax=unclassified Streptomyces TaxID=2593676 RepID=UPI000DC7C3A0|nr:hypothetical protein DRB89_38485 [Streptomyces sp. ICC4]AWZ17139.1 hypothetical protein DRB96_38905 [Streptomyces sp. ICC1]